MSYLECKDCRESTNGRCLRHANADLTNENELILSTDGKLRRSFVLFTGDEVPEIDRLAIVMQVMKEMDDLERRAAVSYMADYYGFRVYPK